MMFLAQISGYERKLEIIHAVILDPRNLRGTAIDFHRSKVQKEKNWQHLLPTKNVLMFGELEKSERRDRKLKVLNVKFAPTVQFRGVVTHWDPVHMQAMVEYPELQEVHPHNFNSPWLAKGDRVIVEGNPEGLEWNIEDFSLHRRVQTCKLEAGTISDLYERDGCIRSQSNEEIDFDYQDVLLCDCRDFYPQGLLSAGYDFDLRETFAANERVFFIRAQDPSFEKTTIKIFVPKTEFGQLDPIFEPTYSDNQQTWSCRSDAGKLSCHDYSNQLTYEESSLRGGLRQPLNRTNLRDSPLMTSCPDIDAHFAR